MGTDGKFGFYYKGKYYMSFHHKDSYPSGLGVSLLEQVLNANLDDWIKKVNNLQEIEDDSDDSFDDDFYRDGPYCFLGMLNGGAIRNVYNWDMGESYTYVLDFDNKVFKAFNGYSFDVTIKLEKEEIEKHIKEWSEEY